MRSNCKRIIDKAPKPAATSIIFPFPSRALLNYYKYVFLGSPIYTPPSPSPLTFSAHMMRTGNQITLRNNRGLSPRVFFRRMQIRTNRVVPLNGTHENAYLFQMHVSQTVLMRALNFIRIHHNVTTQPAVHANATGDLLK